MPQVIHCPNCNTAMQPARRLGRQAVPLRRNARSRSPPCPGPRSANRGAAAAAAATAASRPASTPSAPTPALDQPAVGRTAEAAAKAAGGARQLARPAAAPCFPAPSRAWIAAFCSSPRASQESELAPNICTNPACGVANPPGERNCVRCSTPLPTAPGTMLHGRYRIERLLAMGGFGAVYLANDTKAQGSARRRQGHDLRRPAGVRHPPQLLPPRGRDPALARSDPDRAARLRPDRARPDRPIWCWSSSAGRTC